MAAPPQNANACRVTTTTAQGTTQHRIEELCQLIKLLDYAYVRDACSTTGRAIKPNENQTVSLGSTTTIEKYESVNDQNTINFVTTIVAVVVSWLPHFHTG